MAGVVGLVSVTYSRMFEAAIKIFHLFFHGRPQHLLWVAPLGFVVAGAAVQYVAPGAAGSGIPQVIAVLKSEGIHRRRNISRYLSFKVVVIKILASLLMIVTGGAIGREGPTIQIGSALYVRGIRIFSHFIKVNHKLMNDETAVLTGAAAGLAAAFNTPLGGIVFAVEELAKNKFKDFLSATILSVVIAGFAAQVISGTYLYLGVPIVHSYPLTFIPIYALVAGIIGVCGAVFGQFLYKVLVFRSHPTFKKSPWIFPLICGILMALIYNFVTPGVSGPGIEGARSILLHKQNSTMIDALARFFGPIISYAAGSAGGVFSPSLSAGATIGSSVANLFNIQELRSLFGLLGMVSFLTGLTRAPLTAFVLVYEMSDIRIEALPILLAAVSAQVFARLIGTESFYEMAAHKLLEDSKHQ